MHTEIFYRITLALSSLSFLKYFYDLHPPLNKSLTRTQYGGIIIIPNTKVLTTGVRGVKYHESYLSEKKALPLIIALAILLAVAACSGAPGRDDGALYDRPEPGHEEPAAGIGSGHAAGSGADGNIGDGAPDAQQPGGGDQTGSAPSEEAIVWREPKIEALVREKLAKPTGGITRSELQYFWGIELFGESHIFFNAFGGYRMPLSPDSYNAPYNPDVIDNPDNIIFHLDYNHIRFT